MFHDFGKHFYLDISRTKTSTSYVFSGSQYRISIISDYLIRFEYSKTGSFNDYPTLFAKNRTFGRPNIKIKEDKNVLIISNNIFTLEYIKEKPFVGTKLVPDQNLKVTINGTDKVWYFNHPEARNFMGTSFSLDNSKGNAIFEKGLIGLDGFTSIDDSKTPILNKYGNILSPNYKSIDTYLFVYNNDYGNCLKEYFNLTGMPPLIPRYALGIWWYKNEEYTNKEIQNLINEFKFNKIPLSVLMLGDYVRKKVNESNISFTLNENINKDFLEFLHQNNVYLGLNIKTDGSLSINEKNYDNFSKSYELKEKKDVIINPADNRFMNCFLKDIIDPFLENTDFLWVDNLSNKEKIKSQIMNYFLFKNFSKNKTKRNFLLSRNNGIIPHSYGSLYSGNTIVSWKTLKLLPFYNSTSANIGISWWSHDIGGFKQGIEDPELYMRYVQLGTFSPIFRLSSDRGKYYKREPWKWDAQTKAVTSYYMTLRHRLIPYLYSEARKYNKIGSPLVQPIYYKYPTLYDETSYKNEYYFGSSFFVAPITNTKDITMNRVLHKIFLPNGIWYDFKTGKRFNGGKRYVTFYKDEDYPVFATIGTIIPLAVLDDKNINDITPPKKLEIQIFPGRSNTYKLYEDDGCTNMYKDGYSFTTEINYFYKENDYSVSIEPVEGKANIIPAKRSYIIKFRNTKYANDVKVFCNESSIPYRKYIDGNDFIVEFDNIKTTSKIFVYCKGKDIEINKLRVINEELQDILNDLQIETKLKEEIDAILFSDKDIKSKRIKIRKLKKKGLDVIFIKMFVKLLEYIE